MYRLGRYLFNTVLGSILMVLLVLVGFNVIAGIIDELADVNESYSFVNALVFVVTSIPGSIFNLLPFAALIGCLAGLGSMAGSSELVVMRASGVSTARVVWMVMRPAIVVMVLGMVVSEYIAPHTESIAQSERATAQRKSDNLVSREGLWHREGNRFMHFNVVQPNGVLYGVTMYTFDDQRRLVNALYAARAIFQAGHWVLEDVVESELTAERVFSHSSSSKGWDTDLSPGLLNILILRPIDLSIEELWAYTRYLEGQNLQSGTYMLAFWKKVLQPLSTLALVLVAISFVFGPLRQVTMGFRIFIGVLVGIVFRMGQDLLAPASLVYGFQPIYASLLPILVCLVIGAWFLRRAR